MSKNMTPKSLTTEWEQGRTGRIIYTRIAPNEDLVQTIEKLCRDLKMQAAVVRGSLGSLAQASLERSSGKTFEVTGNAIELLTISGEVRIDCDGIPCANLHGTIADTEGRVFGGRFVRGRNPVCITVELVLEEWLADAPLRIKRLVA
jgi:uncharacterized protein